ncbi:MAG: VTT domain-containing protein [Clostridiales Family XIII bacterium]|nr:VTT domain-containing protein [Clostridiales Family XIII bacterium]
MNERAAKIRKAISYLKIALLFAVIIGIPVYCWFGIEGFSEAFKSRDAMNAYLAAHEDTNVLIYLGIQALQVVVGVIPGQIVQFAGGYVFGGPLAYGLSIAGAAIGTTVSFHLARHLGRELVLLIFKEERLARFVGLMDTPRAFTVIILVYLVPGLPKDLFPYAAGLSHIRALPFLGLSLLARSPAMVASLLFGSFLRDGNYFGMGVIAAIVAALIALAFFKRKSLLRFLTDVHGRVSG